MSDSTHHSNISHTMKCAVSDLSCISHACHAHLLPNACNRQQTLCQAYLQRLLLLGEDTLAKAYTRKAQKRDQALSSGVLDHAVTLLAVGLGQCNLVQQKLVLQGSVFPADLCHNRLNSCAGLANFFFLGSWASHQASLEC